MDAEETLRAAFNTDVKPLLAEWRKRKGIDADPIAAYRASGYEARVAKARDSHAKARKACEGKDGDARRDCMRKEMCAQSKDPAKCEAQAKEWMAKRDKAREACKGKEGDERRACVRDQMKK